MNDIQFSRLTLLLQPLMAAGGGGGGPNYTAILTAILNTLDSTNTCAEPVNQLICDIKSYLDGSNTCGEPINQLICDIKNILSLFSTTCTTSIDPCNCGTYVFPTYVSSTGILGIQDDNLIAGLIIGCSYDVAVHNNSGATFSVQLFDFSFSPLSGIVPITPPNTATFTIVATTADLILETTSGSDDAFSVDITCTSVPIVTTVDSLRVQLDACSQSPDYTPLLTTISNSLNSSDSCSIPVNEALCVIGQILINSNTPCSYQSDACGCAAFNAAFVLDNGATINGTDDHAIAANLSIGCQYQVDITINTGGNFQAEILDDNLILVPGGSLQGAIPPVVFTYTITATTPGIIIRTIDTSIESYTVNITCITPSVTVTEQALRITPSNCADIAKESTQLSATFAERSTTINYTYDLILVTQLNSADYITPEGTYTLTYTYDVNNNLSSMIKTFV